MTLVDHAGKAPRGDLSAADDFVDSSSPTSDAPRRIWGISRVDLVAAGVLLVVFGLILLHLRGLVAKPLWNDEQWHAYWSSLDPSQFLAQLPGIPAPVGLGWLAIERVSIEIFGNSAWALRLPPILSIYVLALCTYLLGRYWLPWWMSLLIGAALLCNAPDLVYGLQVKEDVFVSTCAVLAVLLWLGANHEDATTAGRWVRYVIIGLLGVCAIPAVFAIAPLFALDLWRAWRTRQLRQQLPLIATASAIISANLVFYVRLATAVLHINYWQGFFAPHQVHTGLDFVGRQLQSYVPGVFSAGYLPPDLSFPFDTAVTKASQSVVLSVLISVGMLIALAAGCIKAWRTPVSRTVLAVAGGILLLELFGSVAGKWPFGLVRVNLLVIPFLYLLMGTGIWALVSSLRPASRRATSSGGAPRHAARPRPTVLDIPKWAICATLVVCCVAAGIASWRIQRSLAEQSSVVQYVGGLGTVVHTVRLDAKPDDVAVVLGDTDGWKYYMDYYDDSTLAGRPRLSAQKTLYTSDFRPSTLSHFVASRHPASVFVVDRIGAAPDDMAWQAQVLGAAGYCASGAQGFANTATLFTFNRATGACPAAAG